MEPIIITDFRQFNEIIDLANSLRIKYTISQRMSNIHLRLKSNQGSHHQTTHYVFSLAGTKPDPEPNIVSIAKEFNKINYSHLEGQYGYTQVKTDDPHRFKVK